MPHSGRHFTKDHSSEEALDRTAPAEEITISIYLRRQGAQELYPASSETAYPIGHDEFESRFGASEEDVETVTRYLRENAFTVNEVDRARRRISATGTADAVSRAFGTQLRHYRGRDGEPFRAPEEELTLPSELHPLIVDVLGLDTSPQAHAKLRPANSTAVSYTPLQVADAYGFPPNLSGKGVCVALIELGGGFRTSDIDSYFTGLGLNPPVVTAVSVDGGANSPGTPSGPDGEVMLDIEVVGSVAPDAKIGVYFAPNTNQGFIDAVSQAAHDRSLSPCAISISWGGPEETWSSSSIQLMAQVIEEATVLGVTVTVAAGDNGSSDGVSDGLAHVDFPASAPYALACGGTSLQIGSNGQIVSEVVWNDQASGGGATGGGISAVFPVPTYQQSVTLPPSANPQAGPGRGVPDLSGNADPNTGYQILVDGSSIVVGGTSAVAPLVAGLIARLVEKNKKPLGFWNPSLYQLEQRSFGSASAAFYDITIGNNGAYVAGPGWDACSGLGSPNGSVIDSSI